jgi:hypothetical protein
MMHNLLAVAQWITRLNEGFLGVEGLVFGSALFGSLLIYIQHRARREARIL